MFFREKQTRHRECAERESLSPCGGSVPGADGCRLAGQTRLPRLIC